MLDGGETTLGECCEPGGIIQTGRTAQIGGMAIARQQHSGDKRGRAASAARAVHVHFYLPHRALDDAGRSSARLPIYITI